MLKSALPAEHKRKKAPTHAHLGTRPHIGHEGLFFIPVVKISGISGFHAGFFVLPHSAQAPSSTTWAAWAPILRCKYIVNLDVRPRTPARHRSERRRSPPQPVSAVHSTRHCVVITSSSAPVMAAPPATDGDHLRLNYVPESAPPGLRFRGARGGRLRSSVAATSGGHAGR